MYVFLKAPNKTNTNHPPKLNTSISHTYVEVAEYSKIFIYEREGLNLNKKEYRMSMSLKENLVLTIFKDKCMIGINQHN